MDIHTPPVFRLIEHRPTWDILASFVWEIGKIARAIGLRDKRIEEPRPLDFVTAWLVIAGLPDLDEEIKKEQRRVVTAMESLLEQADLVSEQLSVASNYPV